MNYCKQKISCKKFTYLLLIFVYLIITINKVNALSEEGNSSADTHLNELAKKIGAQYDCPLPPAVGYTVIIGYDFITDEMNYAIAKLLQEKKCFQNVRREVVAFVSTVNFPSDGIPSGVGADMERKWLNYWDGAIRRFTDLGFELQVYPMPFIINKQAVMPSSPPGMRGLIAEDLNIPSGDIPVVYECRDGKKSTIASIFDPKTKLLAQKFLRGTQIFFSRFPQLKRVAILPPSDFGEVGYPFGITDAAGHGVAWWKGGEDLRSCYKTGDIYARKIISADPPPKYLYGGELTRFNIWLTSQVKKTFPKKQYAISVGYDSDSNPVDGFSYADVADFAFANRLQLHSTHLSGTDQYRKNLSKITGRLPDNYEFTMENTHDIGEYEVLKNIVLAQDYGAKSLALYASPMYDSFFTNMLYYSLGASGGNLSNYLPALFFRESDGLGALSSLYLLQGFLDIPIKNSEISGESIGTVAGWGFFESPSSDREASQVLIYAGPLFEGSMIPPDQGPQRNIKGMHPQFMRLVAQGASTSEREGGLGDVSRFGFHWTPNIASGKAVVRVYLANKKMHLVAEHPQSPRVVEINGRISGKFSIERAADNACGRDVNISGNIKDALQPSSTLDIVILDEYRGKVLSRGVSNPDGSFKVPVHIGPDEPTRAVVFRAYAYVGQGNETKVLIGLPMDMNNPIASGPGGYNILGNPFNSVFLDCHSPMSGGNSKTNTL